MLTRLRTNFAHFFRSATPIEETQDAVFAPVLPVDARVEDLWPQTYVPFTAQELSTWSEPQLNEAMSSDPWRDNLLLNKWEFATGAAKLRSFPFRYSVPFVLCNARCEFCSAWTVRGEVMPLELIERTAEMLPYLVSIDLVGWGEPLIHPQMGKILKLFEERIDPRATLSLTTNGSHLERWAPALVAARVNSLGVSLHAATASTHEVIMGLPDGAFEAALRGIRLYRALHPHAEVELIFIVTRQNLAEIPDFIRLGEELGVRRLHFRTLRQRDRMNQENELLDYHTLPPYLHPDFENLRKIAKAAIAEAKVELFAEPDVWDAPIFGEDEVDMLAMPVRSREERKARRPYVSQPDSPLLSLGEEEAGYVCDYQDAPNPFGRKAPEMCPSPYTAFYVNGFDRHTTPCCSMEKPPGHAFTHVREGASFDDVWNSAGMQTVRRTLRHGPLLPACRTCTSYW